MFAEYDAVDPAFVTSLEKGLKVQMGFRAMLSCWVGKLCFFLKKATETKQVVLLLVGCTSRFRPAFCLDEKFNQEESHSTPGLCFLLLSSI